LERPVEPEAINDAFREAAEGELEGLLAVEARPLVSSDYVGDPHSAVVDLGLTQKAGPDLFRIVAWYDNEWGYAHRLADMLTLIGERL
jgi:glyceraldehyde 3-phosphate dehydrogenase